MIMNSILAVHEGDYVGEMWVPVNDTGVNFISIPKNINRDIDRKHIDFGLANGIIEETDLNLPDDVQEILIKQYKYNENSNN